MLKVFKTDSVDKKIKKLKKITTDCWILYFADYG